MSAVLNNEFTRATAEVVDITPPKRMIGDAIADAMEGKDPRQPHADGKRLQFEAILATEVVRSEIKPAMRSMFGTAEFPVRPTKDIGRASHKKATLDLNCDFGGNLFYVRSMQQASEVSAMFQGPGILSLRRPDNTMIDVVILEVDNTFVNPNPKKPHIHELSAKIGIPLQVAKTDAQGKPTGEVEDTYHVYEMIIRHRDSRKAYEASHKAYENKRYHEHWAATYQECFVRTKESETTLRTRYATKSGAHRAKMQEFAALRDQINLDDTLQNGTDAIIGQTPTKTSGPGWNFKTFAEAGFLPKPTASRDEPTVAAESSLKLAVAG